MSLVVLLFSDEEEGHGSHLQFTFSSACLPVGSSVVSNCHGLSDGFGACFPGNLATSDTLGENLRVSGNHLGAQKCFH